MLLMVNGSTGGSTFCALLSLIVYQAMLIRIFILSCLKSKTVLEGYHSEI